MTFPTITYKYHGIEDAKALTDVTDQKLSTLEKFVPEGAAVTCEVEFEKVTAHHQGRIYRVEANLSINGAFYRAEATEESFAGAIDRVRDQLDQELSRAKDKQVTKDKAHGRGLKEFFNQFVK